MHKTTCAGLIFTIVVLISVGVYGIYFTFVNREMDSDYINCTVINKTCDMYTFQYTDINGTLNVNSTIDYYKHTPYWCNKETMEISYTPTYANTPSLYHFIRAFCIVLILVGGFISYKLVKYSYAELLRIRKELDNKSIALDNFTISDKNFVQLGCKPVVIVQP